MGTMVSPAMIRVARAATARPQAVRSEAGRIEEDSLAVRALAWLRRLTGARRRAADAPLRAEARLSLGPKKSLVLVNCCGRRVLVGLSGDALVALGEWPQAEGRRRSAKTERRQTPRNEAAR
jgi:flagellar biogenesis protein FliO